MRFRVRNEPDPGPAPEGALITYSRLSPRGRRAAQEPREPVLEAREVPYVDGDLRAFDPERAAGSPLAGAVDDLDEPRRRRGRGSFGAVLLGTVALAAGMVILAYAYGIATRVDGPPLSSAPATEGAGTIRTTLPGDDAARSVPMTGTAPAAATANPPAATQKASGGPAAAPATEGADGLPMDGDFALRASAGARPAPAAAGDAASQPADAATNPPSSKAASASPTEAKPADQRPAAAASADNQPADSTDDLMTNIERLLERDGATAGASGQPGDGSAASAGPTSLVPSAAGEQNAVPQLAEPSATTVTPQAGVGGRSNRLIPPADIPNTTPADTGTGVQ
jgi:hypothetical protein